MNLKLCAVCGAFVLVGHIFAGESLEFCCGAHNAVPSPVAEIRTVTYRHTIEALPPDFSHVPEERTPDSTGRSQILQAATDSGSVITPGAGSLTLTGSPPYLQQT